MKTYIFSVATGLIGSRVEEEIEIEDDCTEKEIQEIYNDWLNNNCEMNYYQKDEDEIEEQNNL